jgi:hypothetical protein
MTDFLPQITEQNYRKKSLNYQDPKLPRKMPQITVLGRFLVMFCLQCKPGDIGSASCYFIHQPIINSSSKKGTTNVVVVYYST